MTTKTATTAKAVTTKKSAVKTADGDKPPVKKTAARKSAAKKPARLDLDRLTVSKAEMAHIIGVAATNIQQFLQQGAMTADEDGRLNLRDNVREYCQRMRERKSGDSRSKSDIETETAVWKLENIKIKNRDWRMQRDRECALEITRTLTNAMMELREQAKLNPALVEAFTKMIEAIGQINVDTIALAVEGEEEETEE